MKKGKPERVKRRSCGDSGGGLSGTLHMARNGAGYVLDPQTDAPVWIEAPDLDTALPGDTVRVCAGRVVRIDRRASHTFVGTVAGIGRFVRVQPLSPTYRQAFIATSARGAHVGDRVVVSFLHWKNKRLAPSCEIVDVIGPAENPSLDTLSVMRQYDLPEAFGEDVCREAAGAAGLTDDAVRLDLRRKWVFTCDPETARDYDDALSLDVDEAGRRVLGVHIADVSHYVREGTALDREAYARGTSVYLVDKVVPMLPEVLSNGLCSLVPGEDRLAFSVFLTFDASGACVARRFAKTVIRSKARFTYDEVLAVLEARKDAPALKPGARRTLRAIGALAAQLRQRTQAAGALDMDVPEAEVVLDETGMMRGITVRAYDAAHQMIEACMVAANEAVAAELWSRGVKILARFHAPPDREKCEELRAGLAKLGFSCGDLSRPKHLAKFLRKIKGDPLENVVSVMVLRSLKRALYSAKDMGHYGLAKKFYAHFTSPIRRYPDLVLHRQLASFLAGKGGRLPMAYLARAALHSSEREQVADEASRALVEIKKYRYLAACGEQTFEAVVVRCMPHGCYVEIPALAVSGLVHISRLSSHYVRYDAFLERLADATRTWKVGDAMTVCVAHVDFDARQIDFVPAQEPRRRRGSR